MKNKLTHEQVLEETKKCNILGIKLKNISQRLEAVETYFGVSNGGSVENMFRQLDFIIEDLQKIIRQK